MNSGDKAWKRIRSALSSTGMVEGRDWTIEDVGGARMLTFFGEEFPRRFVVGNLTDEKEERLRENGGHLAVFRDLKPLMEMSLVALQMYLTRPWSYKEWGWM